MVVALAIAFYFESQATTTVIIVRQADVAPGAGDDAALSPQGALRAEELSRVLADVDVVQGLDAILVGGSRASRETAEPVARRLNLPVQEVDTASLTRVAKNIMKEHKGEIVLVVAGPEEIPILIPRFQGSKKVPDLADREFDNLYIVSIPWQGKVKTLRLHYGARPSPPITAPPGDAPPIETPPGEAPAAD
jgi:broad specificity phosphatase PhoE